MGRKRRTQELHVGMNGHVIGKLRREASGTLSFQYGRDWLDSTNATPISLSIPLSSNAYSGPVVANYFDNLLPDNDELRRRMQAALTAESTQPFDLLARAGADCVGALQLFPSAEMPDVHRVEGVPLTNEEIATMLRDYRERPLGMAPDEDDFRISIAGAQEKTAFLWYRDQWHRPNGATPTTHIFKLPIGDTGRIDLRDSVENEWLCTRIAAEFGLPVAESEIRHFGEAKTLVVERFDRRWSRDGTWLIRLPQEDLCQALGVPPGLKYESDGGPGLRGILDVLLQSLEPETDRQTFFRAAFVYFLLAAIDGHGKNFSISLYPHGRLRLAPLYDIMSAYPLTATRQLEIQKIKLAMAVQGKNRHYRWRDVRRDHWISTARASRFSEAEAEEVIAECVAAVDGVVERVSNQLPPEFPTSVSDPILEGMSAAAKRMA